LKAKSATDRADQQPEKTHPLYTRIGNLVYTGKADVGSKATDELGTKEYRTKTCFVD